MRPGKLEHELERDPAAWVGERKTESDQNEHVPGSPQRRPGAAAAGAQFRPRIRSLIISTCGKARRSMEH